MAVDPDHRNKGIGSNLVGMLQDYAIELGTGYGAMLEVLTMYQRKGFRITSKLFEIAPLECIMKCIGAQKILSNKRRYRNGGNKHFD